METGAPPLEVVVSVEELVKREEWFGQIFAEHEVVDESFWMGLLELEAER